MRQRAHFSPMAAPPALPPLALLAADPCFSMPQDSANVRLLFVFSVAVFVIVSSGSVFGRFRLRLHSLFNERVHNLSERIHCKRPVCL